MLSLLFWNPVRMAGAATCSIVSCNRECHAAAKQLQSSLTCRDVVKKKCRNSNCQSDTFIKPSSKMVDHGDSPE